MYPILSYNYCQALLVACGPLEDWPKVYKAARKGRQFLTEGLDQPILIVKEFSSIEVKLLASQH